MMAIGKRKSRASEDDAVDAQEALRRHFEARFKPLNIVPVVASRAAADGQDSDDSENEDDDYSGSDSEDYSDDGWEGVSGDDDHDDDEEEEEDDDTETPRAVEVVDHSSSTPKNVATMSKKELKAYLSSRPPSHSTSSAAQSSSTSKKSNKATADDDQPEDSAAFLANDLALQRLIAESHILSAAGGNASHWQSSAAANTATNTRAFAAGRVAKKTTDLRFQALGVKGSILSQAKMPMAMRKGITSTATAKESKRRREAKENGIILEREVKKKPATRKKGRGERPVDAPGVGRLRGAQLTISAREARALSSEGIRRGGGGGKKRR